MRAGACSGSVNSEQGTLIQILSTGLEPLEGVITGDLGTWLKRVYTIANKKDNLRRRGTYFCECFGIVKQFKLCFKQEIRFFCRYRFRNCQSVVVNIGVTSGAGDIPWHPVSSVWEADSRKTVKWYESVTLLVETED